MVVERDGRPARQVMSGTGGERADRGLIRTARPHVSARRASVNDWLQ